MSDTQTPYDLRIALKLTVQVLSHYTCPLFPTPIHSHSPWLQFPPEYDPESLVILDHPILSSTRHLSKPDTSQLWHTTYSVRLIDGTSNSIISQALDRNFVFPTGSPETDIVCHSIGPELHNCTRILLAHPLQSLNWLGIGQHLFWQLAQHNPWAHPPSRHFCLWHPHQNLQTLSRRTMKPTPLVEPWKTLRDPHQCCCIFSC